MIKHLPMKESDIFPREIVKSDLIHVFSSKSIKVFQLLSKSKFLNFRTSVNPNHGNETKSDMFSWGIFKSDISFHRLQNTKIFQ